MDQPSPEAAPGRPRADLARDTEVGGTRQAPASGDFEAAYRGTPPWDIGHPQPAFLHLAQTGLLQGRVLDVGCGTGEHALLAASLGLEATGIDAAPTAISRAQGKAQERHLAVRFVVGDALDLAALGERFDTVLDCGLFHVFSDEERTRFVYSLATVVVPHGHYYLLCFSEQEPGDWGPRRVSQAEIRASFASGWRVEALERATLEVTFGAAAAWLVQIRRL
jgi:SAM-dependent methyltransferase